MKCHPNLSLRLPQPLSKACAKDIWNLDERGVRRKAGQCHDIGREGTLVTLVFAGNALSNYLPSIFIFPHNRLKEHSIRDDLLGSVGTADG